MRLGRGYIEILLWVILYSYLGKEEEEEEGRSNNKVIVFITYNN